MVTLQEQTDIGAVLAAASAALRAGDVVGASRAMEFHLRHAPCDPALLHMAGLVRMHEQRFEDAASLFARARAADPHAAQLAFSHATALQWQGRPQEALAALKDAIRLKPDYAESYFEAGNILKRLGQLEDAEVLYRDWARTMPGNMQARLELGVVLLELDRTQDAEMVLAGAIGQPSSNAIKAALHHNYALALARQRRNEEALDHLATAKALNPDLPHSDAIRAEILQDLKRYDEAIALSRRMIADDPANPQWHKFHNDILYRLDRRDEYLKSYDSAPRTTPLLLSKAFFLSHERRAEEALETYREAARLSPDDRLAAAGVASSLTMLGRYDEALAAFEGLLKQNSEDGELYGCAAEAALQGGDPARAVALCERALTIDPCDQIALSMMGTAWRLMEDARDEELNGYDTLIRAFELEAPDGFSSMEDFNAELNAWLDSVHPKTREYLNQSLRGGTQTPDQIFGRGHDLVEKIRARIDQTVARYIADLKEDDSHPFLARRARDFRYSGSWSSRLRDCGFHVNHIHPQGWISSCYYVSVPAAVEDEKQRQGWIKFGEPAFDVALKEPVRRAIQPRPGRLVLFPSYMWHGTVPFHDAQARTTIAFDVVPRA
ncbi:MAG TPA: tetratricopeptide repeat protein [Rhizomicrobium sp.]|nr:tetratricopeptide repeat protein [Rhizomicrobium sp.]